MAVVVRRIRLLDRSRFAPQCASRVDDLVPVWLLASNDLLTKSVRNVRETLAGSPRTKFKPLLQTRIPIRKLLLLTPKSILCGLSCITGLLFSSRCAAKRCGGLSATAGYKENSTRLEYAWPPCAEGAGSFPIARAWCAGACRPLTTELSLKSPAGRPARGFERCFCGDRQVLLHSFARRG